MRSVARPALKGDLPRKEIRATTPALSGSSTATARAPRPPPAGTGIQQTRIAEPCRKPLTHLGAAMIEGCRTGPALSAPRVMASFGSNIPSRKALTPPQGVSPPPPRASGVPHGCIAPAPGVFRPRVHTAPHATDPWRLVRHRRTASSGHAPPQGLQGRACGAESRHQQGRFPVAFYRSRTFHKALPARWQSSALAAREDILTTQTTAIGSLVDLLLALREQPGAQMHQPPPSRARNRSTKRARAAGRGLSPNSGATRRIRK